MKNILIILLLSITMLTSAQDSTNTTLTNSTISETERLVDKYTEKFSVAISSLAETLAVPAEHVYRILVKQAIVDSISWLLIFLFSLPFIIPIIHFLRLNIDWNRMEEIKYISDEKGGYIKERKDRSGEFVLKLILSVIGIVILVISICHVNEIIQGFVNPEYKAIQYILEIIK